MGDLTLGYWRVKLNKKSRVMTKWKMGMPRFATIPATAGEIREQSRYFAIAEGVRHSASFLSGNTLFFAFASAA